MAGLFSAVLANPGVAAARGAAAGVPFGQLARTAGTSFLESRLGADAMKAFREGNITRAVGLAAGNRAAGIRQPVTPFGQRVGALIEEREAAGENRPLRGLGQPSVGAPVPSVGTPRRFARGMSRPRFFAGGLG